MLKRTWSMKPRHTVLHIGLLPRCHVVLGRFKVRSGLEMCKWMERNDVRVGSRLDFLIRLGVKLRPFVKVTTHRMTFREDGDPDQSYFQSNVQGVVQTEFDEGIRIVLRMTRLLTPSSHSLIMLPTVSTSVPQHVPPRSIQPLLAFQLYGAERRPRLIGLLEILDLFLSKLQLDRLCKRSSVTRLILH